GLHFARYEWKPLSQHRYCSREQLDWLSHLESMSPRFVRQREAASPDRQAAARETSGALSRDNGANVWKPRSSFRLFLRFAGARGRAGDECEFRFERQAVIQEHAHAPRPAQISLRDIRSTHRQHRQNRGIATAFHEQRGNRLGMNFVGVSDQVWSG